MSTALRNVPVSTLFIDVSTCFAALIVATASLPHLPAPPVDGQLPYAALLGQATAFALISVFMFACLGLYRPMPLRLPTAFLRTLAASALAASIAFPFLEAETGTTHAMQVLARAVGFVGFCLIVGKLFGPRLRKALRVPRVLIIGCGPEAMNVARDFRESKTMQRNVVGYYIATNEQPLGDTLANARTFSSEQSILDLAFSHGIDEIVVAVRDQRGGGVPMEQLLACRIRGIRVLDLANCHERARAEVSLDSLKSSWLIYGSGFEQGTVRRIVKRAIDLAGSLALLLLLSPIMLATMIAIRLESPGGVFYRQERVGFGGKSFTCIKFRSMRSDAEKDGVAQWAKKNDSRVTRIGSFIRRTRIDELPQLVCVLRGEMSLIGPRPERPSFVKELREQIPFYDLRHSIKPGLTGWAQVRYGYGATLEDARRKHQFDLYYVKNNSLFLDLLVLIETVSVVLFREGQ